MYQLVGISQDRITDRSGSYGETKGMENVSDNVSTFVSQNIFFMPDLQIW